MIGLIDIALLACSEGLQEGISECSTVGLMDIFTEGFSDGTIDSNGPVEVSTTGVKVWPLVYDGE